VTGTKNAASSGTFVAVDAFDVTGGTAGGGGGGGGTTTRLDETAATFAPASAWTAFPCSALSVTCTGGGGSPDDSAAVSNTTGSTATLSFTGTGIAWIGFHCFECGIAEVSIDGAVVATVDTFAPSSEAASGPLFSKTGLTPGSHTLTIKVTGTKNASATDTFLVVDAFDVTS
jgi:hypothetical protein